MDHKGAKSLLHPTVVERLKSMQEEFRSTFKGVDTAHTGLPGTANIVNFKRNYKDSDKQQDDRDRFEGLLRLLTKLAEMQSELSQ